MTAERTARPGEINYALLDPYSLVHGLVGVLAVVVLGLGFWPMLAIAVSWEVLERILKDVVPAIFPHPTQDTLANSIGDVLSALAGWSLARVVRARIPGRHPR